MRLSLKVLLNPGDNSWLQAAGEFVSPPEHADTLCPRNKRPAGEPFWTSLIIVLATPEDVINANIPQRQAKSRDASWRGPFCFANGAVQTDIGRLAVLNVIEFKDYTAGSVPTPFWRSIQLTSG